MRKSRLMALIGGLFMGVAVIGMNGITVNAQGTRLLSGVSSEFSNVMQTARVIENLPIAGVSSLLGDAIIEEASKPTKKKKKVDRVKASETKAKKAEQEAKEQAEQEAYANRMVEVLGYVPEQWEIDFFLHVVQAECGDEPYEGIKAVEWCIINRVRSGEFPNTLYGVLTQPHQFQAYSNGAYQRKVPNDAVREIWNNIVGGASNPYPSVLYFTAGRYNPYCTPGFVIGGHYFGY